MTRRSFVQQGSAWIAASYLSPWSLSLSSGAIPLPKGSTVALIAPGSPITSTQLEHSISAIESLGYQTIFRKDILDQHGFLAGTDQRRSEELQSFLLNDEVDAIWAVRGGYGCVRILPLLNQDLLLNNSKPILGYSDLTALINYATQVSGKTNYHCPMPKKGFSNYSKDAIRECLQKDVRRISFSLDEEDFLNFNNITGRVCGGNLTVIASLVGTPYEVDIENKIVLLEDIGEKPYRIDRMLQQIDLACDFSRTRGVLLGKFVDCDASFRSFSLRETLYKFFARKDIPVIFNFPFGHIDDQLCIPFGPEVTIDQHQLSWK